MQAYCFRFYFLLVTVILFTGMVQQHSVNFRMRVQRHGINFWYWSYPCTAENTSAKVALRYEPPPHPETCQSGFGPESVTFPPVHLCHLLLCQHCTCVYFSSLKHNGVFTSVITSGYTDLHTAHATHICSGAGCCSFLLIYSSQLVRAVQPRSELACFRQ